MALDLACLHRQITEWETCHHSPRHTDLTDAYIQMIRSTDQVTIKAIRSATAGRRTASGGILWPEPSVITSPGSNKNTQAISADRPGI